MNEEVIAVLTQKIAVMEVELKNHNERAQTNQLALMGALLELKQGIGIRVEQAGKDIAVLYEKSDESEKRETAIGKNMNDRIEKLENQRNWVIASILLAWLGSIWALITGKSH